MGCSASQTTAVEPMHGDELTQDQDEGGKLGSRGDSAVSKVTADSGVVMEASGREDPSLPGAVPGDIPPSLTGSPGLLMDLGSPVERPESSEILDQLLSQGIIPEAPARDRGSGPGPAYDIMVDDGGVPRRRPPARLESLKEMREQRSPSRETIDHKMAQAEERRKQKEDEIKTRLRTKSARVRVPAPASAMSSAESGDAEPPEDQELQTPTDTTTTAATTVTTTTTVTTITPDPQAHTQVREDGRGVTEGSERGQRDSPGVGREEEEQEEEQEEEEKHEQGEEEDKGGEDDSGRDEEGREDSAEGRIGVGAGGDGEREGGDGGPGSQEEVLQVGQLLTTSGNFESDPSFQKTDDIF